MSVESSEEKKTIAETNKWDLAIISIDLETRGSHPEENGIKAVGGVMVPLNHSDLNHSSSFSSSSSPLSSSSLDVEGWMKRAKTFRVCLKPKHANQTYETETAEFWSQFEDVKTTLESEAIDYEKGVDLVISHLKEWESCAKEYMLITDNVCFDYGLLNEMIRTKCQKPIFYSLVSSTRVHSAPMDISKAAEKLFAWRHHVQARSYPSYTFDGKAFVEHVKKLKNTHLPDEDAYGTLQKLFYRLSCMKLVS